MAEPVINVRWTQKEWLNEAHSWIAQQLSNIKARPIGPIEQPHIRPWATTMRIPTDCGHLWFKATTPALAHESALTAALAQWVSGRTPQTLAHDPARNWLLMEDGGVTLRSLLRQGDAAGRLREVAVLYARLQRELAEHREAMLALKTPDCRLARFPTLYRQLLDDIGTLFNSGEDSLTQEQYHRLQQLAPRVEAIAAELASFGISETLQHDDLHSNNVMVRVMAQADHYTMFDWGDSSVAHPFLSLVVLLRGAARDLGVEEDHPSVRQIRDAYVEAWELPHARPEVERACLLADGLGRISRALTYHRLLPGLEEPYRTEYAGSVSGWLQEFLESPIIA